MYQYITFVRSYGDVLHQALAAKAVAVHALDGHLAQRTRKTNQSKTTMHCEKSWA